jgi:CheY-like chemotaxis protein
VLIQVTDTGNGMSLDTQSPWRRHCGAGGASSCATGLTVWSIYVGACRSERRGNGSVGGTEEIERKLALSTLLRHRYRVLEASSSVEVLLLAQQHPGTVHVVVSDLMMPEIGGRDVAKRLLGRHPKMKPFFVSGYDNETMVSHRLNPRYLLRRPYRQAGLVEKVRELLDA